MNGIGGADTLRLMVFAGLFVTLALAEHRWPRRPRRIERLHRWPVNLGIVLLDTLALRIVLPLAPAAFAVFIHEQGWGLFHGIGFSGPGEVLISLLLLDLLIYWQHRLFHHIPLLWRLHRMHHTDLDLDVTSGTRFHPLEILLSMAIKLSAVALLGISPLALLLFEIILNAAALFNHANLALPQAVDRWVRLVLVTPDMHRVHHSIHPQETNSNFGFNQPWWDRLLGTYQAQPRDGHGAMVLGLKQWQQQMGLLALLRLPFLPLRTDQRP